MTRVWAVKEKLSEDIVEQLLSSRGITSEKDKQAFFNPKINDYQKDLEIPGIEKSLKRIKEAIEKEELMVVFGDYDVDGITACAILYKALTSIGGKVLPYIPHREKEGYGLSKLGLEFARDAGAAVVITVDNGIVAFVQAEYAKTLGLDLIITDHHTLSDKKPAAFSIVHSTKMCGAAVAWCLIQGRVKSELREELLELVAIATIADMMPLLNVNRAFVASGLKQLNKTHSIGLNALLAESKIEKGEIRSYEIGHIIAPRINAIGRLEHAIDALRLLCTSDSIKAKRLAKLLQETNTRRQDLTTKAYEEALVLAEKNSSKKIQVVYSENWHPGIIGLVAARITQQHFMPTIAISQTGGISKGSARSIEGINITEVLRICSEFLVDVGGHSQAAGFSIKTKSIVAFKKRIEQVIEQTYPEISEKVLGIDAQVSFDKLNKTLVKKLEDFEPFGLQNPQPLFASFTAKLSDIRTVGNGKHLKFKVEDPEQGRGTNAIDAIGFNLGELETFLQSGQTANIAYNLEINRFNGTENLQLKVKDIQFA